MASSDNPMKESKMHCGCGLEPKPTSTCNIGPLLLLTKGWGPITHYAKS